MGAEEVRAMRLKGYFFQEIELRKKKTGGGGIRECLMEMCPQGEETVGKQGKVTWRILFKNFLEIVKKRKERKFVEM